MEGQVSVEANRLYLYISGIGLELACNGGLLGEGEGGIHIIKKRYMLFAFEKTPCVSLSCVLVPVLYQEYK